MSRKNEYSYKDVFIKFRRQGSQWFWEIVSETGLKPKTLATGGPCLSKKDAHRDAIGVYQMKKITEIEEEAT